jgi:hypothetical protein
MDYQCPPIHVSDIVVRMTAGPSRIFGVSSTLIEGWRQENSAGQSLKFAAAAGLPLSLRYHSSSGYRIMWVTMTEDGPEIANIALKGLTSPL